MYHYVRHKSTPFDTNCAAQHHPIPRSTTPPDRKNRSILLLFALCSHSMNLCTIGCHARFVFGLCPSVGLTSYRRHWFVWNGVLSPEFVQPGCTATANHNPSRRDAAARRGSRPRSKEGLKFMQRLVAKQKARIL